MWHIHGLCLFRFDSNASSSDSEEDSEAGSGSDKAAKKKKKEKKPKKAKTVVNISRKVHYHFLIKLITHPSINFQIYFLAEGAWNEEEA